MMSQGESQVGWLARWIVPLWVAVFLGITASLVLYSWKPTIDPIMPSNLALVGGVEDSFHARV